MRISQLAERSGVPATTLRYYESAGLLPAERSAAGYRLYGAEATERLAFIGAAKHLGLPLGEIAALLRAWESGSCRDVRADLRPRLAARIADARQRATELATLTTTLHRALNHLDALPDRHGRCDPRCAFLTTAPAVTRSPSGKDHSERADRWHRLLDGAGREEHAGGVRLSLPADRAGEIAALAVAEQRCCPFLDIRLHLRGPMLRLEITAPAEGAALLAELFTPRAP